MNPTTHAFRGFRTSLHGAGTRSSRPVLLLLSCLVLAGCQAAKIGPSMDTSSVRQMEQLLEEAHQSAAQPAPAAPPPAVAEALLPPLQLETGEWEAERFDIAVAELPARDFFMSLVRDTAFNVVVHPEVAGNISLELKNVSVDQVMQVVRDVYGYDYERNGNLYQVFPTGLRTQIFKIDYLNVQRRGISETMVSAGQVTNANTADTSGNNTREDHQRDDSGGGSRGSIGSRVRTDTEADFWSSLAQTVQLIIGNAEGRQVVVSPQSGVVMVRALPKELLSVKNYLERTELSLRRQVILEAKILEVQLNEGFQAGINWSLVDRWGPNETATFSQSSAGLDPANQLGGIFSAAFDLDNFAGLINLLGTQGTVQVLSSPRIATVNNQKAVIKVGTDEFFVTEVSTQTTTATSTTQSVDVQLTPFFSGIALDVTPQISEDGEIILHIHPTVSEVRDQSKTVTAPSGNLTLPLAISTIRESDSIVKARNGQVVVIGGLMQNSANDEVAKAPLLGDIPILGNVFRQKRQNSTKSELVILLRPIIASDQAWERSLRESNESIRNLRQAIEPGSFR